MVEAVLKLLGHERQLADTPDLGSLSPSSLAIASRRL